MPPHPSARHVTALYDRHAAAFDRARDRSLAERTWLDRFSAAAGPGGTVLDLGCGSGAPLAEDLLARGHAVTGVDAAPAMIGLCRARFPAARRPAATWHVADMRALALRERFAGVLAWNSFFHLTPDDQRAMFGVFAAHAAPDAALMFTGGPAAGEALGSFEGETLYHASLDAAVYRTLLTDHGFDVLHHAVADPACGGHAVWLARLRT